jgi:crotonobetainyl-CoA:carnitine CoA-transferase CaiB-like acyl-CoA transferase
MALAAETEGVYPRLLAVAEAADPAGLEIRLGGLSVAEAISLARTSGARAAPVRQDQRDAFLDDPAHLAARLSVDLPHPDYGVYRQPGAFWDFGDLSTRLENAAPSLGQHTTEVLAELGLDAGAISALAEAKVVA